jgi:hypothetical protein
MPLTLFAVGVGVALCICVAAGTGPWLCVEAGVEEVVTAALVAGFVVVAVFVGVEAGAAVFALLPDGLLIPAPATLSV